MLEDEDQSHINPQENNLNLFPTLRGVCKKPIANYKLRQQHVTAQGEFRIRKSRDRSHIHRRSKQFQPTSRLLRLPQNSSIPVERPDSVQQNREKDNDILQEICEINGFTLAWARLNGKSIDQLEVFFTGFSRFNTNPSLEELFPNVKRLIIMSLKNLVVMPKFEFASLEELWISESNLIGESPCAMNYKTALPNLKKVFLYSNKIEKFDTYQFETKNLSELSLANNKLKTFPQAINNCSNLITLNLANNLIESMDSLKTVTGLARLETLELSNNLISLPTDLTTIAIFLTGLRTLNLANPVYDFPNPICRLAAYTLLVISFFENHENLKFLDTYPLSKAKTTQFLSKLIGEKRKFYFMMSRQIFANAHHQLNSVNDWKNEVDVKLNQFYQIYHKQLSAVDRKYFRKVGKAKMMVPGETKPSVIDAMEQEALSTCKKVDNIKKDVDQVYEDEIKKIRGLRSDRLKMLEIEFETMGNVEFVQVSAEEDIFDKCEQMIYSDENKSAVTLTCKNYDRGFRRHVLNSLIYIKSLIFDNLTFALMDKHDDQALDEQYFFMENSDIWPKLCNGVQSLDTLQLKFVASLNDVIVKDRVVVCRIIDKSRVQPIFIMYLTTSGAEFIKSQYDELFSHKPRLELPEPKFVSLPAGNFGPIGPTARTPEALFFERFSSPVNAPSLDLITHLNISCSQIDDTKLESHKWAIGCLKSLIDLNLSHNELETFKFLQHLHEDRLDILNVRFNHIKSLETIENFKIAVLDVQNNEIAKKEDLVGICEIESIFVEGNTVCNSLQYDEIEFTKWIAYEYNNLKKINGKNRADLLTESLDSHHKQLYNQHWIHNLTITDHSVTAKPKTSNVYDHIISKSERVNPKNLTSICTSHSNSACSSIESFFENAVNHKFSDIKYLDLSYSYVQISCLKECEIFQACDSITHLCLENCGLTTLQGFEKLTQVEQLFLASNNLTSLRDIYNLKTLSKLTVLDLSGNDICREEDYRAFVIYHLCISLDRRQPETKDSSASVDQIGTTESQQAKALQVLDNNYLNQTELHLARDMFGGRLTMDALAEFTGGQDGDGGSGVTKSEDLKVVTVTNQNIRTISLVNSVNEADRLFPNLHTFNLQDNLLKTISGLVYFRQLRVLNLSGQNKNQKYGLQSLFTKPNKTASSKVDSGSQKHSVNNSTTVFPILPNLEVLHIANNQIKNMAELELDKVCPNIYTLFLQNNHIVKLGSGLQGLPYLKSVIFDHNRIKEVTASCFIRNENLRELHLSHNRLRNIPAASISFLHKLERLFLTNNRIASVEELNNIDCLQCLHEVSFAGNPVTLRQHRAILVATQPNIQLIDGIVVSIDERAEAEAMLDAALDIPDFTNTLNQTTNNANQLGDVNFQQAFVNAANRRNIAGQANGWDETDRIRLQNLLNNRAAGGQQSNFSTEYAKASLAGQRRKFK